MVPSFLLLHVITNEKTLKLKQIDRLPALPRFSPQKHVPTTLVGIPVDIYTLIESPRFLMRPPVMHITIHRTSSHISDTGGNHAIESDR